MAIEIEEELTFYTKADQLDFNTKTNGDKLFIHTLKLSQAQATTMTWLVNADDNAELEFNVKVRET
ncbi:hypothetical protein LCGC14_3063730 [marine sediment metagenome]|uniref:Uncharacterized protein n=1 Tax=marine sediment metagenome TaxID=412755 RepID=A0A0F8WIN9_9ZZZZ